MTTLASRRSEAMARTQSARFHLNRAGILNVWQYDEQEFTFAGGRMLLRGTNGAGKSKTLEMLLPFVLDGDKARMTSSARHHTSLLWLMTDGYDGQARVGYLWVEFARVREDGSEEFFTCGVGIRASASARTATAWFFTTSQRIGTELSLEDDAGPLSRPRLAERIDGHGHVFEQARLYKEHVGRTLFGLTTVQYDEVLRLLYWLRQPQVGEDIEPKRLGEQLLQALPQLDDQTVRSAGETFDELTAFGEQIDRRAAAAEALAGLNEAYAGYARGVVSAAATAVSSAMVEERDRDRALLRLRRGLAQLQEEQEQVDHAVTGLQESLEQDRLRLQRLDDSPEARSQSRLNDLGIRAGDLADAAAKAAAGADRARERVSRREGRLAETATDLIGRLRLLATGVQDNAQAAQDSGVADFPVVPAAFTVDRLSDTAGADQLDQALAVLADGFDKAGQSLSRRQAALTVVRRALTVHLEGRSRCGVLEKEAALAEQRWEDARRKQIDAEADAEAQAETLWQRLEQWRGEPAAVDLVIPAELTAEVLEGLGRTARDAAAPKLSGLREIERTAGASRDRAQTDLVELTNRRDAIDAERDPAPRPPELVRSQRPDGAGLWQLVDFRPELTGSDRAGIEAALQASGLLDAWVRPDGALLDSGQLDTLLPVGPAQPGRTLLDVLQPDCRPGADVREETVAAVLSRIALSTEGSADARVAVDGSWQLGPLQGRAEKTTAQYVGASARAAERERRLAEVDALIELATAERDKAIRTLMDVQAELVALEAWLSALPSVQPLLQAWAAAEARAGVTAHELAAHEAAQGEVLSVRREVARLLEELHRLARENDVPHESGPLEALGERLRELDTRLARLAGEVAPLRHGLRRWADERGELDTEAEAAGEARLEADDARRRAAEVAAELDELTAAVGASVTELQARRAELQRAINSGREDSRRLDVRSRELVGKIGGLSTEIEHAEVALAEQANVSCAVMRDLGAMVEVPGLMLSATDSDQLDLTPLAQIADVQPGDVVPAELPVVVQHLQTLGAGAIGDENAVWRSHSEAANGPAADHEPRVATYGRLLAVIGRDEGGECSIGDLAARVAAGVQRDRDLLTQRERERFEQHILGELGDAIRRRRIEADELVGAMNGLLAEVTTSQGIRMKLDWRLRDDVPLSAREAIQLLTQPVGALLPEERANLRDSLHRLIEASRAESPELSYSDHLAAALDYRRWFEFRIKYTRPETEGKWAELHRRSPLSQGEQKVLCYLPLFAAAAAHFTSLAGAAPHAPRLVLLDDAFPKIDVRTHPLLFGLLVQLDLDFVITSERLWGDHDTVPSLAIYEALRDPAQRGIAQYEYRWDGRSLRSIG